MALLEKAYSFVRLVGQEEREEEEYTEEEEEGIYDEESEIEQTFFMLNRIAVFGYSTDHMFL